MTKRSCPFEESNTPQLKHRITEKYAPKKVMENVWNKTKDLLFEAAKKKTDVLLCKDACNSCQQCGDLEQCDFCSKNFCLNCGGNCIQCDGIFCSYCSTLVYEVDSTDCICLSCLI